MTVELNVPEEGLYIVIEGIDGAGKTTLSQVLYDRLYRDSAEGGDLSTHWDVLRYQWPSGGPVGQLIRRCLSGKDAVSAETLSHLFMVDLVERDQTIRSLLSANIVVCDRHQLVSDYSYHEHLLGSGWLGWFFLSQVRKPDLIFTLDVPVEECERRLIQRGVDNIYDVSKHEEKKRRAEAYREAHKRLHIPSVQMSLVNAETPEEGTKLLVDACIAELQKRFGAKRAA